MDIRNVLERRLGEERIEEVFDVPGVPYKHTIDRAIVVTVKGAPWLIECDPDNPGIEFGDGRQLDDFLTNVEQLYKEKFQRKLKMDVTDSNLPGLLAYVILGTRSKGIKDFIKSAT